MSANVFLDLQHGHQTVLPAADGTPAAGHLWQQEHLHALIGAYATGRPLLLRGEAGSGKSQMARAAAAELGGPYFKAVIHARFEARDLLYRIDTLARLADAQANQHDKVSDLSNYIRKGQMYQALEACGQQTTRPVLLIDEIDKADPDVPNALLDVLGNGSFVVDETGHTVASTSGQLPLVLITTNEERELPTAFVRRCLVLNLNPPADEAGFKDWLIARARSHPQLAEVADPVLVEAASQVWTDRCAARDKGQHTVGLAEYLDLLRALVELSAGKRTAASRQKAQQEWLAKLRPYFLVKAADLQQATLEAAKLGGKAVERRA